MWVIYRPQQQQVGGCAAGVQLHARGLAGWAGPGLAGWLAVLVTGNDNNNSLCADLVNIFYF